MNIKDFSKRFKMLQNVLKYPKADSAIADWYQLSQAMSDDEIDRAFSVCITTMKEWPAWSEFREAGKSGAVIDSENQASILAAKLMKEINNPKSIAESSLGFRCAVGLEIFEFLGGHFYWYDVMSGNVRTPSETQIQKKILAFLKEKKANQINEKIALGESKDAKRISASH